MRGGEGRRPKPAGTRIVDDRRQGWPGTATVILGGAAELWKADRRPGRVEPVDCAGTAVTIESVPLDITITGPLYVSIGLHPDELTLIRNTAIFGGLDDVVLRELLSDGAIKMPQRGEVLFTQGDPANAFFIVLEGWVKIYRMTRAGEEAIVNVFTRGQSFAEAAAFTGGKFPASAEAVTDCRLLMIPSRHLFDHIRARPELGLTMLASTSQQLHSLVHQIQQLKAYTGAQRLAEFLLSLAPVDNGACTIALPYDKALIAGRLGMKPESLSRAFLRLREYGVRVKQNMATISDVRRLRNFFEQERAEILRSRG